LIGETGPPLARYYPRGNFSETVMAQTHHDLRKDTGKPGIEPTTNAKVAGHEDKIMPTPPDNENAVNPGVGSKAGMAEGQVTKSN
jgi:hypothetical protein